MTNVNAVNPSESVAAEAVALASEAAIEQMQRARLYSFFEFALAHPGEDGHDWLRQQSTEAAFADAIASLAESQANDSMLGEANAYFTALRSMSYEEVEAAHIGLFSSNFPHLPCPPYGSLFTAPDADKRLDEMLAIKDFYHRNGVDISESFDDLPDHLCVELEFCQLLCFRENDAILQQDEEVVAGIRKTQTEFLDRFLLPLANSLVDLSAAAMPTNPYTRLLKAMQGFLAAHRAELARSIET